MIYRLAEWLVILLLVSGIITQLLWPALCGTKLFPLFRTKLNKLEQEKAEVNQVLAEQQVADEIAENFKKIHSEELAAKVDVTVAKQYVVKQ